ncbi:GMC family oxidoreductase N-terminal domain-containing protein [Streptomyces sp. TRM 70351]|uniref:GMC family oxidoreductase N-terminal domain-containing protein n=1 Tax=Streptomyces sp. TRM 70351 TaxID=3116552 RepID=UPI002E7BCBA4|nr:GMC family oxidoreductase N-terminal domain-containing protein [Streptomyces sp. TRM 70351]MEE1931542.1 GMC family oxidoreductase N-terminal domain-containing protein [Streptomyces sp. TRM 70351]
MARGKLVGDSSADNIAIALRGHSQDYDSWATRTDSVRSFENLLPHFRAVEHDLDFTTPWHGTHGPVPVRRYRPEELHPLQRVPRRLPGPGTSGDGGPKRTRHPRHRAGAGQPESGRSPLAADREIHGSDCMTVIVAAVLTWSLNAENRDGPLRT